MRIKNPADFSRKIKRGAAFMDVVKPGWEDRIDLSRLDLHDIEACVLGQSFAGFYKAGTAVLRDSVPMHKRLFWSRYDLAILYGFEITDRQSPDQITESFYYSALTEQWIEFIRARRAENNRVAEETVIREAEIAATQGALAKDMVQV